LTGFIVRSDGNNFIPELAAACIAVKACPSEMHLTLRSDSLATIGAISKGSLSERKRVRAAGRPWLNFCRQDLTEKRTHLHIEHVSSHKGTSTPEQRGNDLADCIANRFRVLGEHRAPRDYFTESEERFLLRHNNINIQGDPRQYLKNIEREVMISEWKGKDTQGEFIRQYPTQIMKQAQRVWKWAIERGEGRAWLYFIFGICQWLPVNHRTHYKESSGRDRERCFLLFSYAFLCFLWVLSLSLCVYYVFIMD